MTARTAHGQAPPVIATFADSLIEAGWLAIAIAIPLFFNIYSNTVFDPDKANLLRTIAFLMGAAWVAWKLTQPPAPAAEESEDDRPSDQTWWKRLLRAPLALPVVVLLAVEGLSTAFSVLPRESFWGSFTRGQGLVVTCSYVVLFALVAARLRRPEQWARLRFALVTSSVPILIYGFLQRAGQDPMPWTESQHERIGSSLGNPIFLGAYLIMLLFITGEGLIAALGALRRARARGEVPGAPQRMAPLVYCALLALQLVALVMTRSRGPLLALLAALFIVGLVGFVRLQGLAGAEAGTLGPWVKRGRRAFVGLLVLIVLAVGFLAAVGAPNSPLASLRSLPDLDRLSGVFDLGHRTVRVRRGIWEGVSQLVLPHEPLDYSDGATDRWNSIRPLLGTGPETLYSVFGRFHSRELAQVTQRGEVPDRSHNEILDSWVMTGALGALAHLFLFGGFFYYALRCLGLVAGRRERLLFVGSTAILSLAGAAVAWRLIGNPSLVGIGIPLGFLAALTIYIVMVGLRRVVATSWTTKDTLALVILGAVTTHFLEIQFGLAVTTTRMLFWLLAGLLVAVGSGRLRLEATVRAPAEGMPTDEPVAPRPKPAKARGKKKGKKGKKKRRPLPSTALPPTVSRFWPYALMSALILVTIGFGLIVNLPHLERASAVLVSALTEIRRGRQTVPSLGLTWILLLSAATSYLLARPLYRTAAGPGRPKVLGSQAPKYFLSSLGITLVCLFLLAGSLARAVRLTKARRDSLLYPELLSDHLIWYYALASILIFGLALTIVLGRSSRLRPSSSQAGTYALAAAAGLAVWLFALGPASKAMRASVLVKQGVNYERNREWALSQTTYEKALALRPKVDQFYLHHGRAASEVAKRADAAPRRDEGFRRAIASLERAQSLNPLRYHHPANLARSYRTWALQSTAGSEREARLEKSLEYFRTAIEMSPETIDHYVQSAEVYQALGQLDQAREQLELALGIDPDHAATYTALGELTVEQAQRATQAGDQELARRVRLEAVELLEQAVERKPRMATAHNVLSTLYVALGRKEEAVAAGERFTALNPKSPTAHSNLAKLYEWNRQFEEALEQARKAQELEGGRDEALAALVTRLEGRVAAAASRR